MTQFEFNADDYEDVTTFSLIPEGWYNASVDETEIKSTKTDGEPNEDGTPTKNKRLSVRFNILDGEYVGRKIYIGFNIKNINKEAETISFMRLGALTRSINIIKFTDTAQLHDIPLAIRVVIKKSKDENYGDSNDITSYKQIVSNSPLPSSSFEPSDDDIPWSN